MSCEGISGCCVGDGKYEDFYNEDKFDKAEILLDWYVKNNPNYTNMWGNFYNQLSRQANDELEWHWQLLHKKHKLKFPKWKQRFKQ